MARAEIAPPVEKLINQPIEMSPPPEEADPHAFLYQYVSFVSHFSDSPESFARGAAFAHAALKFPEIDNQTLQEFSTKLQTITNRADEISGKRRDATEILGGRTYRVDPKTRQVSVHQEDLKKYIAPIIESQIPTPKTIRRKLAVLEPDEQFGADFMKHLIHEQMSRNADPQAPIQLKPRRPVTLASA